MANIPFKATPDHSEDLVVSEDNGPNSIIPAHLLRIATHIVLTNTSVDDLGSLSLPIGQSSIDTILLQGPDLFILQHDGAVLVIDDFLGALETGMLTGLSLSDGTSMDAIEFLDAFGGGKALDEIMFSLETAEMDVDAVDGSAVLQDGSTEMLDFANFCINDPIGAEIGSGASDGEMAHREAIAPLANSHIPAALESDTLSACALLVSDAEGAFENNLPHDPDGHGIPLGEHGPFGEHGAIHASNTGHTSNTVAALSFGPSDAIPLPEPVKDDVSIL